MTVVTALKAGSAKLIASNAAGLRAEATVTVKSSDYLISFNANGGTVTPASAQTVDGRLPELPVPTREGYRFLGWFLDGTEPVVVTTDTVFTEDTEIYAQWERSYTVTFDPVLGEAEFVTAQTVGGKLEKLPDCRKPGYTFVGWFDQVAGGRQITLDEVYTADTTLYARWQVDNPMPYEYPVTFHANGVETSVLVPMNETIGDRMPADPVRAGYRFVGWNTEPDGSGDPVTADTCIDYYLDAYAQWEELPDVRIVVQFTHTFFAGFDKVDRFVLAPGQSMTAPGVKLFGPAQSVTWTSADGSVTIRTGETLRYEDAVKLLGDNVTEGAVVSFVS